MRRELYSKHLEFFDAGREHRERMFCAGNRVGKTITITYETAVHATGRYPDWWTGRRFQCPIDAWIAGQTAATTRDILQLELCGKWNDFGTGMIPADALIDFTTKRAPAESVDTIYVKHASGGVSMLGFKAYAEGPGAFQGTAKHLIAFDEEMSLAVYTEALLRTAIVPGTSEGGLIMIGFTPLLGWSEVVNSFLAGDGTI